MQMHPSTNTPSVKMSPPSITRNSASAIRGRATTTRARRSEPWFPRIPRSPRATRRTAAEENALENMRCSPAIRTRTSGSSAPAEPAAALGELGEGLFERLAREFRPQLLSEDELRVGRLPQQVVRQPSLAARADDQVGIVHLGRVQQLAEVLLAAPRERARRIDDLRAPTVVESDEQGDPRVRPRELFSPAHALDEISRHALAAADEAHAHTLLVELGRLIGDAFCEHRHQALDLLGG